MGKHSAGGSESARDGADPVSGRARSADDGPPSGVHRLAAISLHTSPMAQPGTGDAGGMNVYIDQTARRLAARGGEVENFTRATSTDHPRVRELTHQPIEPQPRGLQILTREFHRHP